MPNDFDELYEQANLLTGRRSFLVKSAAAAISAGVASILPVSIEAKPNAGSMRNDRSVVSVAEKDATYILQNGIVSATIDGHSGALLSLQYKGVDMLGKGAMSNGYWSMPGTHYSFGQNRASALIDDPAKNGGERATVSCKFDYDGSRGSVPADVEFRYSLARGDQAIYLQAIWNHKAEYPALMFPVGRFAAKLNDDVFDWMTVDARRNRKMITAYDWDHGTRLNLKEARRMNTGIRKGKVEHKYDYCAVQFDTPAYGWSSTQHHVGIWMVTADYEYMSGGPTKLELTTHRDATFTDSLTAPAAPVLLNVWKGPHYGGTSLVVAEGEAWTKTVGPFLLYCNSGNSPDAMWQDALAKAAREAKQWPYAWAASEVYPGKQGRGAVHGHIVLKDPQASGCEMKRLRVGLAHADYALQDGDVIDWQRDGKYYQFWTRADEQGCFNLANVRPGTYTLHAIADGVLGEYIQTNVTVAAGSVVDLGALQWTPARFGKQLWEIGIPTRTAADYLHGDHYWQWGLYNSYPKDFPNDVNYVIGKSDYRKDWNIMQVPRAQDDTGRGKGPATTWSVIFDMKKIGRGKATLRIAFAGTEARNLAVAVNDQHVEMLTGFRNTSAIHRDADRSYWTQRDVAFDASLLKAGRNVLKLIVPAGGVMNGMMYDYLRLEMDETARPPATA